MTAVGPFVWDDDPARVDRDVVWDFLSTEAYWGKWRSREQLMSQLDSAWRVVGCYDADGRMVGFARGVSVGFATAHLVDLFVLASHRGRGLGQELVRTLIEDHPGRDFRWILQTKDAHDLYRRFGFVATTDTEMERPAGAHTQPGPR